MCVCAGDKALRVRGQVVRVICHMLCHLLLIPYPLPHGAGQTDRQTPRSSAHTSVLNRSPVTHSFSFLFILAHTLHTVTGADTDTSVMSALSCLNLKKLLSYSLTELFKNVLQ